MDDSITQEAIDGLDSHRFPSIRAAARHFGVNQGTLQNHIDGTLSRRQAHKNDQSLSPKE
jgi:hypothetical protein